MFNRPKATEMSGDPSGRAARPIPTDYQTKIGRCNVQIFGLRGVRTPDGLTRILDEDHLHAYVIDPIRQIEYAKTDNLEPVREIIIRLGDAPKPSMPSRWSSITSSSLTPGASPDDSKRPRRDSKLLRAAGHGQEYQGGADKCRGAPRWGPLCTSYLT